MAEGEIDNLTMEQYLALTRGNQAPGVVKPEIGGNVNFEIKSQFMRELREDTFSGNKNDDAHEHVERVLDIVSLFNIPGVSHDAVMLRVFPITLTGAAKRWVDRLPPGTVDSWDLLKKAFIQRYCPPSRTAKQLEEIRNFKQEGDETLYQAWERYNDLLYKCPTHDINNHQKHDGSSGRSIEGSSFEGIAVIVNKLENLGRDMKKLKENVHAIQVGYQNCEGAHLDKDCPLKEEVKSIEEAKYGEFGRPSPFSNGASYRVGPPRYYTRMDNRLPVGEKRPSLEELMNKNLEESTRKRTEMEELKVQGDSTYWWHDQKSEEEEERRQLGIDIEEYNPPMVYVKTFEVKRYSFDTGQNFICVIKELMDALPLGIENGSRFRDMIRKEVDSGRRIRSLYKKMEFEVTLIRIHVVVRTNIFSLSDNLDEIIMGKDLSPWREKEWVAFVLHLFAEQHVRLPFGVGLWHIYAVSSFMDTAYWSSEQ
ncbi:hypothetical protein Tco_1282853 [Tanacetum coccineum]